MHFRITNLKWSILFNKYAYYIIYGINCIYIYTSNYWIHINNTFLFFNGWAFVMLCLYMHSLPYQRAITCICMPIYRRQCVLCPIYADIHIPYADQHYAHPYTLLSPLHPMQINTTLTPTPYTHPYTLHSPLHHTLTPTPYTGQHYSLLKGSAWELHFLLICRPC